MFFWDIQNSINHSNVSFSELVEKRVEIVEQRIVSLYLYYYLIFELNLLKIEEKEKDYKHLKEFRMQSVDFLNRQIDKIEQLRYDIENDQKYLISFYENKELFLKKNSKLLLNQTIFKLDLIDLDFEKMLNTSILKEKKLR